ncbi:MAG: 2-amino-4-hydroxy-6-hydroxymethyldihydropteridine diphosphokinase [Capnocytophaga granulosa]
MVFLSLGSNLGNRAQYLQHALFLLHREVSKVVKVSPLYESPAWGFSSEPFYNICAELHTDLPLEALLPKLHAIEARLGRVRTSQPSEGYKARTLDIDILYYDDKVVQTDTLCIPHPQLALRRFVLQPLADIAPDFVDPAKGQTISQLLEVCPDTASLTLVKQDFALPVNKGTIPYHYITIEGNIGAGKTSLATRLAEDFSGQLLLEEFATNPFLEDFYKQPQRYALATELSFLKDRYKQLQHTLTLNEHPLLVADYAFSKSLIFAQETLPKKEYTLYEELFYLLFERMIKPDLYIYLHQHTDTLLKNIQKRGRSFETPISKTYLERIEQSYLSFLQHNPSLNTLFIDVSYMDFVNNQDDYQFITALIQQ